MKHQSFTQRRWFFLITCSSQFPGDQKCRYMPSKEKRKVTEFSSGLSDMTALRGSKELPVLQSLPCYVPSCKHGRGGFLFILCLSHCCQRVTFWHCLLLFEPDALQLAASGGGCRLPVPPADGWVGVRRSGSPGTVHTACCLSLPLRVESAVLGHPAPSWKDLFCFS